eukprot:TRINITY_DN4072_c0_g1_i1.p1 TRINITY_DN4072_c0_g1~~TRINITY_DN4072_c0_g1_i1.p1  ORF type:complete len:662 (+),score=109.53 TRINITY_DN4072_c0_g1_i1:84-1988(+)
MSPVESSTKAFLTGTEAQNTLKHIALLEDEAEQCLSEGRRWEFVELGIRSLGAREGLGSLYSEGSEPLALVVKCIEFLHQFGLEEYGMRNFDTAKRHVMRAEKLLHYPAISPNDLVYPRLYAANLNFRALLARTEGDLDNALYNAEKALGIVRRTANINDAPNVYLNVGAILSELGRHSDALSVFLEAVTVVKDILRGLERIKATRTRLRAAYSSLVVVYHNMSVEQRHLRMDIEADASQKKASAIARAKLGSDAILTTAPLVGQEREGLTEEGGAASEYAASRATTDGGRPRKLETLRPGGGTGTQYTLADSVHSNSGAALSVRDLNASTKSLVAEEYLPPFPPPALDGDVSIDVFRALHQSTVPPPPLVINSHVPITVRSFQPIYSTPRPAYGPPMRSDEHTTVGAAALGTISAHLMREVRGAHKRHRGPRNLNPTLMCSVARRGFTQPLFASTPQPVFITSLQTGQVQKSGGGSSSSSSSGGDGKPTAPGAPPPVGAGAAAVPVAPAKQQQHKEEDQGTLRGAKVRDGPLSARGTGSVAEVNTVGGGVSTGGPEAGSDGDGDDEGLPDRALFIDTSVLSTPREVFVSQAAPVKPALQRALPVWSVASHHLAMSMHAHGTSPFLSLELRHKA